MTSSVITLKELFKYPYFRDFTLIGGVEGLSRAVKECGILEYQFAPEMKTRYHFTAFAEGTLVLTSFMYAVDNEYLIGDALRRLNAMGVAGLVIKNVYHIHLPESVTRFANAAKFPIFLVEETPAYAFSEVVRSFYEILDLRSDSSVKEKLADELLNQDLGREELIHKTLLIYPSIGQHYRADFYLPHEPVPSETWREVVSAVWDAPRPFKTCFRYRAGLFLLHTLDATCWSEIAGNTNETVLKLRRLLPNCAVGISLIHHMPDGLPAAMEEALQAAAINRGSGFLRYDALGTYRILLRAARDYRMQEFSDEVLQPVFFYDAEENGRLIQTLFGLVECGRNLHQLSEKLQQHENTLRQRMARVASLTGLDFRNIEQYEQLSMAVKIHQCIAMYDRIAAIPEAERN